ncbi:MAG: N,N'-diacetylchitobiose phosphorylase, partial [Lachnospiraceae bacterium]|nr:N,N'-diacetylchitobiose phosphorylase [Lachnospiraceae bacterium]
MKYGYFDEENKEYVITNPATPAPWVNYLGDPEYGAIISNNAAGYSFVKSGANGRITRFKFNTMMALPGRYIYLRDAVTGDYWSASWQPVGKPLDQYKSECRHGTAYTVISVDYSDIRSDVTYYVPLGETYEVWCCDIKNNGGVSRKLNVFGFVEFTNEDNYEQDQVNLQYSLFISQTKFEKNRIMQTISEHSKTDVRHRFLGVSGAEVTSYCGDPDKFIGAYRTYSNPVAVEKGSCDGSLNYNDNSCGALCSDIELVPGESIRIVYILGAKDSGETDRIIASYSDKNRVDDEIKTLKEHWHSRLDNLVVHTPSDEFNNMINVWNAYQCFITFTWSRAASFIYCGLRNGYGYRDTVQDIQGIIHLDPEAAADRIRFMLSAQVDNGGGLPLVKFTHNAGHENTPDDPEYVKETGHPSYRADDALWLFPTVVKYIGESGNKGFLDEVIVYANGGEASVYDHLKNAIRFSEEHMGPHGMPAG